MFSALPLLLAQAQNPQPLVIPANELRLVASSSTEDDDVKNAVNLERAVDVLQALSPHLINAKSRHFSLACSFLCQVVSSPRGQRGRQALANVLLSSMGILTDWAHTRPEQTKACIIVYFSQNEATAIGCFQRIAFYNPSSAKCVWFKSWIEAKQAQSPLLVNDNALSWPFLDLRNLDFDTSCDLFDQFIRKASVQPWALSTHLPALLSIQERLVDVDSSAPSSAPKWIPSLISLHLLIAYNNHRDIQPILPSLDPLLKLCRSDDHLALLQQVQALQLFVDSWNLVNSALRAQA